MDSAAVARTLAHAQLVHTPSLALACIFTCTHRFTGSLRPRFIAFVHTPRAQRNSTNACGGRLRVRSTHRGGPAEIDSGALTRIVCSAGATESKQQNGRALPTNEPRGSCELRKIARKATYLALLPSGPPLSLLSRFPVVPCRPLSSPLSSPRKFLSSPVVLVLRKLKYILSILKN